MPNKSKKAVKPVTVEKFDAMAEAGEDLTAHLDLSKVRVFAPGEERVDLTIRKVNLDIPQWMIDALDRAAARIGVTRQSIIKTWLADRLERI